MGKYDDQLSRMMGLMEYKTSVNESRNNVEYHTEGADGKVYGILKEGMKYYIKTTTKGKENLSESYDYINGFNNRKENEYSSYNEATKQLELKLMSLNEAYGVKKNVSTVDFNRSSKTFMNLTEQARTELNRVNQIMENSEKIGMNNVSDPEGKHHAESPESQGDPFGQKATYSCDGTHCTNGNASKANDYTDVKNPESQLTSDKNPGSGADPVKDYKKVEDDLEGKSVAAASVKGGKAVMVNEGEFDGEDDLAGFGADDESELPMPEDGEEDFSMENTEDVPFEDAEEPVEEPAEDPMDDEMDSADELGSMLEEFESLITGPEDTLDGPHTTDKKGNSIAMKEAPSMQEEVENGGDKALKGPNGKLAVQTWDKMNESQKRQINRIVEGVCNRVLGKKKKPMNETLQQKINRIVKEEATKLNVWGDHPSYGKEPMTHPEAREVLAGTADRDFNDNSTKGSEKYGKKIGKGNPYNILVDAVTDKVLSQLKESLKKK